MLNYNPTRVCFQIEETEWFSLWLVQGGFTSKNYRWWLLLILLLSVASIRRKLLKTNHTEESYSVHTNSESCNIQPDRKKNQFNSEQIIQILLPLIINFFRRIRLLLLIFNNIFFLFITCFIYDPILCFIVASDGSCIASYLTAVQQVSSYMPGT